MVEINLFKASPDAYEVEAGSALFTEGELGDVMYAVIEGRIDVTLGGQVVEQVGPGGILGELALIDASPRAPLRPPVSGLGSRVSTRSTSCSSCRSTPPSRSR